MKALEAVCRFLWRLLQELGDEKAYERHLKAHGLRHSSREWRKFADGRLERKFVRPRCC